MTLPMSKPQVGGTGWHPNYWNMVDLWNGIDERIRDAIGATLVAGVGLDMDINDAGDTVTLNATGGGGGGGSASSTVTATTQSGSTYTLTLADAGTAVELTNAAAVTVTVPLNASVTYPIGTIIELLQYGAGQVTVAPASGVTIRTPGTLATRAQYSTLALRKRATDEWVLTGDTA
jgi:hypothetical protein